MPCRNSDAEFLQTVEFLHEFLLCELGSSGNAWDLRGHEKSPRALMLYGFLDLLGLRGKSWNKWMVETSSADIELRGVSCHAIDADAS